MAVDIIARGLAAKAAENIGIPGPKGDPLTYEDLTVQQIEDIRSGITAFNTIIRGEETRIGIITLFGSDYDLYRIIVDIVNIPTTLNEEGTFTLAEIPLGFNLYLKTDSLVVAQEVSSGTTDFYNNSYTISKLFVDSDLSTKVTIKCINAVSTSVKASIQVEYIKDFGDILELNVAVPVGVNPADVNLSFPKLKYNKTNVASLTIDDSYSIWNNVFSPINKRWVDAELMSFFDPQDDRGFYYHKDCEYNGYTKTNGFYPTKPLEYTDGAGIKHRFGASVAAWHWKFGERDYAAGILWPWVSAVEARFMQDFGISFNYHDILGVEQYADTHGGSTDVPQNLFNEYVRIDRDSFISLIDKAPKILQGPNGDPNYIYKARLCPDMQYTMEIEDRGTDSECSPFLPFNNTHLLDKKSEKYMVQRAFISESYGFEAWKNDVIAQGSVSESNRKWTILGLHRPPSLSEGYGTINALADIEGAIGASGDDSLWFPAIDELYEYWFMTRYGSSFKTINEQTITFKIHVPCNRNFWFKSISCLLSGINNLTGVSVTSSSNCNGTSFAINDDKLLINLDFNTDLIAKVEKYLSVYENSPLQEYAYDDALYFIQMLKPGVREPYQQRLDAVAPTPTSTPTITPTPGPTEPTVTPTSTPTITPTPGPTEPTVAVCSFTGSFGTIEYPVDGTDTINVFDPANIHETFSQLQFKSKTGELIPWYYEKNISYYQANYTTTDIGSNLSAAASNVSTSDSGPYSDIYLANSYHLNGTGEYGGYKGRMVFSLPIGTYKLKVIMGVTSNYALEEGYQDDALYRIDVNGTTGTPVAAGVPGFLGINNSEFNAEIDFTVDEFNLGNVNLYIYNEINWGYRPSINLVEIIKTA